MSTVLIVDDDPTAREILVAVLEGENYRLELAKDGYQALQVLGHLQPDLILLDIMMPRMNGIQVAENICCMKLPTSILLLSIYSDTGFVHQVFTAV